MIDAIEVKNRINKLASQGLDFIFGVDFELDKGFVIENPKNQDDVLWRIGSNSNFKPTKDNKSIRIEPCYVAYNEYKNKFDTLYKGLHRGDSFLANLTEKTEIKINASLKEVALKSNAPYTLYVPNRFVCFSPEIFVQIKNGIISSNPMKGTIDGSIENAEQVILSDYKETAEHYTIVDLIRSDLSRVATDVKVESLRYIDRLKTSGGEILQVSSKITGKLPNNYKDKLGDTIFELLPAGSVSGAPKPSTVNLIKKSEQESRGYYCGIFGYYDGISLDTAVTIRYIEQIGDKFYFRSGSGVTINSTSEYEYNEINQKIYLPF